MRNRTAAVVFSGVLGWVAGGCDTMAPRGVDGSSKLVIPEDARAVITAPLHAPPPISGGTLAVSPDGQFAVAADPDRDRVSIVGLQSQEVRHLELSPGDQPGRISIDAASQRAYVALRGSGEVLSLDVRDAAELGRGRACAAPRGMALQYDADRPALLHVACADGRIVSLRPNDLELVRDVAVQGDLRDVFLRGDTLQVSTFKTAEILTLDSAGEVVERSGRGEVQDFNGSRLVTREIAPGFAEVGPEPRIMRANLGWRSVQARDGSVFMLHQASQMDEVDIERREADDSEGASPYGGGPGGFGCSGIVQTSITQLSSSTPIGSANVPAVVAVDLALDPLENSLAVVEAGTADRDAPRPFTVFDDDSDGFPLSAPANAPAVAIFPEDADLPPNSRVHIVPVAEVTHSVGGCGRPGIDVPGQAIAVAYAHDSTLVIQSREPALLTIVDAATQLRRVIKLGGDSVADTGHELFHRDGGAGIACASCHAEGAEDGHTWAFSRLGLRRTQALHVGLEGTAPFHWGGDEKNLTALMEDVFVGRMGGVHQSEARTNALARFLFDLEAPEPSFDAHGAAAERGKLLFETSAGCTACHAGAKLTDNKSYDVGTSLGERLQVPSLRGIAYRAPFIHTGCARTLRDRFDPACGGEKHGNVSQLASDEVDDLVAYLKTL